MISLQRILFIVLLSFISSVSFGDIAYDLVNSSSSLSDLNQKIKNGKRLQIDDIQNKDLGIYSATCMDSSGSISLYNNLVVAKDAYLQNIPYGMMISSRFAQELIKNKTETPATILRSFYKYGSYNILGPLPGNPHIGAVRIVIEESPPELLKGRRVEKRTFSSLYQMQGKNGYLSDTQLEYVEFGNLRVFVAKELPIKELGVVRSRTCVAASLIRQYYKGSTFEHTPVATTEYYRLFNLTKKISTSSRTDATRDSDGFSIDRDGFGVVIQDYKKPLVACSTDENEIRSCDLTTVQSFRVKPANGMTLKSYKGGAIFLSDSGKLYHSPKLLQSESFKDKNALVDDLSLVSNLSQYDVLDYVSFGRAEICFLSTSHKLFCVDDATSALVREVGSYSNLATSIEYVLSFDEPLMSYIVIKDKNGREIDRIDY